MGQNKEELNKLLGLIERIACNPSNEKFIAGLQDIIIKSYQQDKKLLTQYLLSCINAVLQQPGYGELVDELHKIIIKKYPERSSDGYLDSYLRLQRDKCKRKAKNYYKSVSNKVLKEQLIEDHARMLWSKIVDDVESYFTYVNLQIECMLNYYLSTFDFRSLILAEPDKFIHNLEINKKGGYTLPIDCTKDLHEVNGQKGVYKFSSLWCKIWVWAVCSGHKDLIINNASNIEPIIKIRNLNNHRDISSSRKGVEHWKNLDDDQRYSYVLKVLKNIRDSIV